MDTNGLLKHKEVVTWWLENSDKGVWCRHIKATKWFEDDEPSFHEMYLYVQNDRYAELRKAQVDGKVVEDNTGLDWSESRYLWDLPVDRYRIKPDEPEFKIGDWVYTEMGNIARIIEAKDCKVESIDGSICYENPNAIKLWQPKEGEWCVVWNDNQISYRICRFVKSVKNKFRMLTGEDTYTFYDNIAPLEFLQTLKDKK